MGNEPESNNDKSLKSNIILVWIDKKVNNNENMNYQKEFRNINNLELNCFETVYEGINFLKKIEFKRTIIITSGSIYSEFINEFKKNINELRIAPRIIIFTSNKSNYINKSSSILPINHTFYNAGGVVDYFGPVKEFILSKKSYQNNIIEQSIFQREKIDKFNFEYISDKNQLILPLFFPEYIKVPTEVEIQFFNKYMLKYYDNFDEIKYLYSQLVEVSEIPVEILSKFWIRSYTAESDFYRDMNKNLQKNKIKNYLPFIQMVYEAIKKKSLKPIYDRKLYRGTLLSKKEFDKIQNYMSKKIDGLPGAIVYGRSFFSFTDNENVAQSFKNRKKANMKSNEMVGLFIIEQSTGEKSCTGNASIKEFSYFKGESEILFFPFSSFEIKKIQKINEQEFIIILNYLGKYDSLFQGEDPKLLLQKVPEGSKIAKQIFLSNILDPTLELPKWAKTLIGAASGAITGAIIGSFIPIPGFGTLAGAAIGGGIGAYVGNKFGSDSDSD